MLAHGGKTGRGLREAGGGRGIRTPERVSPLTVFKTAGINHSPIPPASLLYKTSRGAARPRQGLEFGAEIFQGAHDLVVGKLFQRWVDTLDVERAARLENTALHLFHGFEALAVENRHQLG